MYTIYKCVMHVQVTYNSMFIQYVMINILFQDMWLYKIHRVESQRVIKKQLAIN